LGHYSVIVNDKYQIPPIIKIVIIAIIVILIIWYIYRNIFHPISPSCSLNSKLNYSYRMTTSGNLFSRIYKLTMNEQNEVNYQREEIFYLIYRNHNYGFLIHHAKKLKERTFTYETFSYRYE